MIAEILVNMQNEPIILECISLICRLFLRG
jgi:hypothetical protein